MMRFSWLFLVALSLAACGGPPRTTGDTARSGLSDEDEDEYVDEEEGDETRERGGGFIDDALRRTTIEPIRLGERAELPGTGVSIRPPAGAMPMPFGVGFVSTSSRVQISVVVAEGAEDILDDILSGGNGATAPEPEQSEAYEVAGHEGRIGRDQITAQQGELERSWLLVHDGTRGLGVIATYEAERGAVLRPGVREVLESVRWNPDAQLDASEALGIRVGPVEGLELSRRTSANVVLTAPGAPYPPEAGNALITVLRLPVQVPPEQARAACAQIAAQLLPAPSEDVESEGAIEDGALSGCERLATAETRDGERLVAYAAVLFNSGMPLFLSGSASADELETWSPRFASAARTVRERSAD